MNAKGWPQENTSTTTDVAMKYLKECSRWQLNKMHKQLKLQKWTI